MFQRLRKKLKVMAKRKCFNTDKIVSYLRNIFNDVSKCKESESVCDNLDDSEQDSDFPFSNESELDLSESFNSLSDLFDRFSKQPQIQNELETIEAPQEINDTDATLSASNIQEENEQSNDVTLSTAQNELPSLDTYNNTASSGPGSNSGVILTAPDGTEWLQITPGKNFAIRHLTQNISREVSGPTPYVKRNVVAGSSASAWSLLIDNFILKHIEKCTITKAHSLLQNWKCKLAIKEWGTFIAVMYAWGCFRKKFFTFT